MDKLTALEIKEVEGMEEKEGFKIKDVEQVNWAFRKIRAYKNEIEQNNKLADKEIERINSWRKKENEAAENSIEYFEGLITEYFVKMREVDPKYKVSTPYGKVSTRKQQPKWNYDDKKVVEWLKENGKEELIRVKEEPSKADIKKAFKVAGNNVVTEDVEIVEGIEIEKRGEKINIKVVED